jgi:Spy/CpxP family protein refolding chaperone
LPKKSDAILLEQDMNQTRFSAIALLTFCAGLAVAQPSMPPPDQRPMERIERLRKVRLIEMLDLKEDQSVRFFARMNEHDKVRKELKRQKGEVLDRIERLVRNHAEDQEFEKEYPAVRSIDAKLAEENWNFFDTLKDILTPEQRGKFLLFERHFEVELRDAMREAVRQRHREDAP